MVDGPSAGAPDLGDAVTFLKGLAELALAQGPFTGLGRPCRVRCVKPLGRIAGIDRHRATGAQEVRQDVAVRPIFLGGGQDGVGRLKAVLLPREAPLDSPPKDTD